VLASSVVLIAGGITSTAVGAALGLDPNDPAAVLSSPALPVVIGISLASTAVALVLPTLVYHLTSTPKEADDRGGLSMPGIFSAADPTGARAKREAAPTPDTTPETATPDTPTPAPAAAPTTASDAPY
jgi:hypothetical protein